MLDFLRLIDLRIVDQQFPGSAVQVGDVVPARRIDEPVSLLAVQSPIAAADHVRGGVDFGSHGDRNLAYLLQ